MTDLGEQRLTTALLVNPQYSVDPMPAPVAGIFDEPTTCVTVNEAWVSFIIERLKLLTNEELWLGDDAEKLRASEQIQEFIAAIGSAEGNCMYLKDIRIVAQTLEKTFDNENWEEVGAVGISEINISTGEAGTNASSSMDGTTLNITIPRGDVGAEFVVDEPALNPNEANDDQRRCNVATGLVTWLFEKYNDVIDQIEAAADTVSAMDAIIAIFPPAYLIADQILDAVNEVLEAGTGIARAFDTVEKREQHQKWFYCHLQENGALEQSVWNDYSAALSELFDNGTPGGLAYMAYIAEFEFDAVRARAAIESYGDGNCIAMACDEWEHYFDFRTGLHGWTIDDPINGVVPGHWVSGQGVVSDYVGLISGSNYREIAAMRIPVTPDTEVTFIDVVCSTANTIGTVVARFFTSLEGSAVQHLVSSTGGSWSGSEIVDLLTFAIHEQRAVAFPAQGTELKLISMEVHGKGDNPFV